MKALYNHMLASQDQSGPVGGSTYFMPLSQVVKRPMMRMAIAAAMEQEWSHIKYQESITFIMMIIYM